MLLEQTPTQTLAKKISWIDGFIVDLESILKGKGVKKERVVELLSEMKLLKTKHEHAILLLKQHNID